MEAAVRRLAKLVLEGDYDAVRQVATVALATGRTCEGQTTLMLAADASVNSPPWQYAKCIEYLLHLGADPEGTDRNGDTAAHVAVRRDNLRLLALLPFEAKFARNESGLTPLMEALMANSVKCVKHLLHLFRQGRHHERRNQLLRMLNYEEKSAMNIADSMEQEELSKMIETEMQLVIHNSIVFGLPTSKKDTFNELKRLAIEGDMEAIFRIVDRVNCDLPDGGGATPLMWAVKSDSEASSEISRFLAEIGDPTASDTQGRSCLHWAARVDNDEAIVFLVSAGAPVNGRDADSRTPLMSASVMNSASTVQALISAGADWSMLDGKGRTAHQLAMASGCLEVASLLSRYTDKTFFDEQLEPGSDTPSNVTSPTSSVSSDSDELEAQSNEFYPVTVPQGYCLIIDVHRYDVPTGLQERIGSQLNVGRIRQLFERLRFIVDEKVNCTAQDLASFLSQRASSPELANHGCFVCFLMAHGTGQGQVYGRDGRMFDMELLTEPFQDTKCALLKDKPKLFFVQVSSVFILDTQSQVAPPPVMWGFSVSAQNIPDTLMCHSIQCADRRGPVLVQILCDIVERYYQSKDLEGMLRILANQKRPVRKLQPALPVALEIVTRLTKRVCLDPSGQLRGKRKKAKQATTTNSDVDKSCCVM